MRINSIQIVLSLLLLSSLSMGIGLSVPQKVEKTVDVPGDGKPWKWGYYDVKDGQEIDVLITTSSPVTILFDYSKVHQVQFISSSERINVTQEVKKHMTFSVDTTIRIDIISNTVEASVTVKIIRYGVPQNATAMVITSISALILTLFPLLRNRKNAPSQGLIKGARKRSNRDVILQTTAMNNQSLFVWGIALAVISRMYDLLWGSLGRTSGLPPDATEVYHIVLSEMIKDYLIFFAFAIPFLFSKDIIDQFKRTDMSERSLPLSFRIRVIAKSLSIGINIYTPLMLIFFVKYLVIGSLPPLILTYVLLTFLPISAVIIIFTALFYEMANIASIRFLFILIFVNYLLLYQRDFPLLAFGILIDAYLSRNLPYPSPLSYIVNVYTRVLLFFLMVWFVTHEKVYETTMRSRFWLSEKQFQER